MENGIDVERPSVTTQSFVSKREYIQEKIPESEAGEQKGRVRRVPKPVSSRARCYWINLESIYPAA